MSAIVLAGLLMLAAQEVATPAVPTQEVPVQAASSPYLELVAQYQHGDSKQAVAALATWPEGDLQQQVLTDLTQTVIRAAAPSVDRFEMLTAAKQREVAASWASLVPAAAVMHLEASRRLFEKDQQARALAHVRVARQLADWPRWAYIEKTLASDEITRVHEQLRHDVYVLTAWVLQTQVDLSDLDEHLRHARDVMPGDAEIWLASGSAEEIQARVWMMRRADLRADIRRNVQRVSGWREAIRREYLSKAESYYRESIKRDATLAEAHARLGHVLFEQARLPEARVALTRARELALAHPEDGQESIVAYLASLFLAGVADASGKGDEALDAYQEVVKRWPGCQSGHMGLSRVFESRGERALALGALQPLWSERVSRLCPSDPWWLYDTGQAWRLNVRFATVRARVKS